MENKVNEEVKAPEIKDNKKRTNVEAKPGLDKEKLKNIINIEYAKSNAYHKIVQEAVDNMTEKLRRPILELIEFADASLELVITEDNDDAGKKKKSYNMKFNLTDEELNFLAIKIPTACIYVQEYLNERALDVSIAEYMLQDSVTENLKTIMGGDAKERLRFAEQQAEVQQIVSIVKKQVYTNLKGYIERADKVYEGVKKVLDGKNSERRLFGKSNTMSA